MASVKVCPQPFRRLPQNETAIESRNLAPSGKTQLRSRHSIFQIATRSARDMADRLFRSRIDDCDLARPSGLPRTTDEEARIAIRGCHADSRLRISAAILSNAARAAADLAVCPRKLWIIPSMHQWVTATPAASIFLA